MLRTHTCGELNKKNIAQSVTLSGWVASRRDHGGIIFVDLRDSYGLTQVVFDPQSSAASHEIAENIRDEWVIRINGKVRERGKGLVNPRLSTGEIEIYVEELEVISEAITLPFELELAHKVREDLRLEYRYLDLRRSAMQDNLKLRAKIMREGRNFLDAEGFIEIETPILVKGTPEGSREYLVPSRLHAGEFYVLPQSPQQLKQLLMVGGVDKYYQFPRCFRDEDLRGDRQPEFTQFEIEMAFCEQEDILNIFERCFTQMSQSIVPHKKILSTPFPRITWKEALSKYGSDKPDIRFDLAFVDMSDETQNSGFAIFEKSKYLFALMVSKKIAEFSRKDLEELTQLAQDNGAGGLAWIRVGEESGPVAKNAKSEFLKSLISKTQATDGDMILFGASNDFIQSVEPLGAVRKQIGERYNLYDINTLAYLWVVDFPLFETNEEGNLQSAHHPFTMPIMEDISLLETHPTAVRSQAYDLVLNGIELGGGSIRIYDRDLQKQIFSVLGMSDEEAQSRFGHLLKAFAYGCPPHGGCAMGLDRIAMIFADMPNIREVIAFPKNQSAQDVMLGAPASMPEKEVHEQNISVRNLE